MAGDLFDTIELPKTDVFDTISVAPPPPAEDVSTGEGLAASFKRGIKAAQNVPGTVLAASLSDLQPGIRADRLTRGRVMDALLEAGQDPNAQAEAYFKTGPDALIRETQRAVVAPIVERSKEAAALPTSTAQKRLAKAEGGKEKFKAWAKDPIELTTSIILESLPASITGAAVGALGGPPGMATGAGLASGLSTFSSELFNNAATRGVDIYDADAVTEWLNSKNFQKDFDSAAKKSTVVGAIDAATAGAAGRFVAPAIKEGLKKTIAASAKEVAMQAAGGAGGEVAGSVAADKPIDAFDVFAEAIAEVGSAPAEVAGNIRGVNRLRPRAVPPVINRLSPPVIPPPVEEVPNAVPIREAAPVPVREQTQVSPQVEPQVRQQAAAQPAEVVRPQATTTDIISRPAVAPVGEEPKRTAAVPVVKPSGLTELEELEELEGIGALKPKQRKRLKELRAATPVTPAVHPTVAAIESLDDEAAGQLKQRPAVIEGMKLTAQDVPALEAAGAAATARMAAAGESGNDAAFKAEYGRMIWYSGAIEGANRKGPNYDFYLKELEAAKKPATPAVVAPVVASVTPAPVVDEVVEDPDVAEADRKWKSSVKDPTPGTFQSIKQYGKVGDILRGFAAVLSGRKRLMTLSEGDIAFLNENNPENLADVGKNNPGLSLFDFGKRSNISNWLGRFAVIKTDDIAAANELRAAVDGYRKAKSETKKAEFYDKAMRLLGYSEQEVTEFGDRLDLIEQIRDERLSKPATKTKGIDAPPLPPDAFAEQIDISFATKEETKAGQGRKVDGFTDLTQYKEPGEAAVRIKRDFPYSGAKGKDTDIVLAFEVGDTGQVVVVGAYKSGKSQNVNLDLGKRGKEYSAAVKDNNLIPLGAFILKKGMSGFRGTMTRAEYDALAAKISSRIQAAKAAQTQTVTKPTALGEIDEKTGQAEAVVVEPSVVAEGPEALSELESWLRGKLQDKKTGMLKPITPDMARDLVDEFSIDEPESAKQVSIDIASPLAKTADFQQLKRGEQLERLRELFAARIYELVQRQYQRQQIAASGQDIQRGAGPTPAGTGTVIDIEAAAQPTGTQPEGAPTVLVGDPIDNLLTRGIDALAVDRTKVQGQIIPIWIVQDAARAALVAVRAAYRAGRTIAQAVEEGIAGLRNLTGFNENEARAWLTAELNGDAEQARAESTVSVTKAGIDDDPNAPPPLPDEQWVPTQVQGTEMFVRSRDRLTPETAEISISVALDAFTAAGFPVERRTFTDQADNQTKTIFILTKTENATDKGKVLAERVEQEIRNQRQQGKSEDYVAMLINSIRENFDRPESAMADMDTPTRNRLFSLAQEEASTRGRALRALRNFKADVIRVSRNVDVMLNRIYWIAFGGDEVSSVMRRVVEGVRAGMTPEAVNEVATKAENPADIPAVVAAVTEAVSKRFSSVDEVVSATRDGLIRSGMTEQQAGQVISQVEGALRARVRGIAQNVAASIPSTLTPEERAAAGGKKWRTVAEMIAKGVFDDGEVLAKMAKANGWRIPTSAEVIEMRRLADEEQALLALTEKERAGKTEAQLAVMQANVAAATRERRDKIRKKLGVMWAGFAVPTSIDFKNPLAYGQQLRNNARFINELVSANLLLKPSFATKQLFDISIQWIWRMPQRAMAEAMARRRNDLLAGRPNDFFADLQAALGKTFGDAVIAMRPAIAKARAAWAGRIEVRNVDRLLSGINALEQIWNRADEMAKQNRNVEAFLLRAVGIVQYSYRYAGALDFIHGTPSEWHERRHQIILALRENGLERAAAEVQADLIMGDIRTEIIEAAAITKSILEARGEVPPQQQIMEDAYNVLEARQFQRANELGLDAADIWRQAELYRNTIGWNQPERRGVGGAIGASVTATGQLLENFGIPSAMGRFGNAIAIGINRNLHRTFLYKAADIPLPIIKGGQAPSFWSRTQTDIYERRIEASVGTAIGAVLLGLVWTGAWKVWMRPPQDKEDRELWEREGHKAGTVEIPLGDGTVSVWSLTTGPMALFAPYLAAGGALNDLSTQRDKQRAKLEADAIKLGLPPGELPPVKISEWIGVGVKAFEGSVLGSRTASGLYSSITDFGKWNIHKFGSSQLSPIVPGLPAMQEVSRMAGIVIDPAKADIIDFMFPLPTSGARKVNMLGDPVGTENDLQRVVQVLTAGSFPVVNLEDAKALPAYQALYTSGFKPPSIDPLKGYAIAGQFRPLEEGELARYAEARGRNLKQALSSLPPDASAQEVRDAYRVANEEALAEVGVTSRQVKSRQRSGSQPQPSSGQVASPSISSGRSFPSYNYSGSRISGRRSRSRIRSGRRTRSRIRTPRFRRFGGRRQGSRLRRR